MKSARTIKLDEIRIDGGTQIRVNISQETVYKYKENMEDGDQFPPVEVVYDGASYWLIDGFHRYHAMKLIGYRTVEVLYRPGTLREARILALAMNSKHGLPRTNADKRNAVEKALEMEEFKSATDADIAKACDVSKPFVAAIRRPEAKERQKESMEKHIRKRAQEIAQKDSNAITDPRAGEAPDEAEMRATELAHQADLETMHKLLEADEPLKVAHEEIKKLTFLNAQLEVRLNGLMAEKNEAVKMVKSLQKQLDKLKKEK